MATITTPIRTIVNVHSELFTPRPRVRYADGDERIHTDRHPICEDRTCPCWPPLLADNAWKLDGNWRAPALTISQDEAAQLGGFYSGIDA